MDLVSVVIPAYNSEKLIAVTLESVIAQGYPELEIIVVDDGSADGTAELAEQTLNSFPGSWKVLRRPHKGVSAARNAGWRAARGSWIHFLDSDDVITPDKIELQMAAAQDFAPAIAVVYSSWQRVAGEGSHLSPEDEVQTPQVDGKPPASLLILKNCIPVGTFLIRREWLETSGGLDEQIPHYEDLDLLLRIACAGGQFRFVPSAKPLLLWRMFPGPPRMGGEDARYKARDVATVYLQLIDRSTNNGEIEGCGLSAGDRDALIAGCTFFLRLLYRHDRHTFQECLRAVRRLVPGYPQKPLSLWLATKCLGYERAVAVAGVVQPIVRRLRRA